MNRIFERKDKITIGSFNKSFNKQYRSQNKCRYPFDTNKCVLHLIDLTQLYVKNYMRVQMHSYDSNNDSSRSYDHSSYDHSSYDISSLDSGCDYSSDDINNTEVNQMLENHLSLMMDYITDQHGELWNMMKKGDLIEDISITRLNDDLECLNDYLPTRGRYIIDEIIDNDINDKNIFYLKSSDITRNGLTIKYLNKHNIYKISQYAPPLNFFTITNFPIGYFDDIVINDYLCPNEIPRSCWGMEKCLISLDIVHLGLNKLNKNKIYHKIILEHKNDVSFYIDYLYIIIIFDNIRYMIISEYSSEILNHDMKKEKRLFVKKFKTARYLNNYDKDNKNIKMIAFMQKVAIENVLYI